MSARTAARIHRVLRYTILAWTVAMAVAVAGATLAESAAGEMVSSRLLWHTGPDMAYAVLGGLLLALYPVAGLLLGHHRRPEPCRPEPAAQPGVARGGQAPRHLRTTGARGAAIQLPTRHVTAMRGVPHRLYLPGRAVVPAAATPRAAAGTHQIGADS